ncbi:MULTISPECIES: hypothetical protein [Planomicrobium]|uniref:Uncharacterized protein n=1 Tax=Planomicrobium okeanokoites TaxID=244 RepID=A0ABV7KMD6_PLAOK|nr:MULTISPECIES: hypothetical protein [Planomicrobium]
MPKYVNYLIIIVCIILIVFLYNRALGSVPLIILSLYLFYYGWKELGKRKNKSR